VLLVAMLSAALALGAQAAPLADGQTVPSSVEAPPSTSAGSTLDRTLQVDTEAAQRDVGLLLETRGVGAVEPPPPTRRPSTVLPTGPAAAERSAGPVVEREPIPEPIRTAARFVLDRRHWLLGALGLVAVMAVGVQLWRRHRAGASERRLRALAGQQRPSRGRRRSSRH
jgi:hypothetical protein